MLLEDEETKVKKQKYNKLSNEKKKDVLDLKPRSVREFYKKAKKYTFKKKMPGKARGGAR